MQLAQLPMAYKTTTCKHVKTCYKGSVHLLQHSLTRTFAST